MSLKTPLRKLLTDLERISQTHDEMCDTDTREVLAEALYCGFIASEADYKLPQSFEMFSEEGDAAVRNAILGFLSAACAIADKLGWNQKQRQDAFQDIEVTSEGGLTYDEFFGHADDE